MYFNLVNSSKISFEDPFSMILIFRLFCLNLLFDLLTWFTSERFKLGEELTGSTYDNCANLTLRYYNVLVLLATSQEALSISLGVGLMADLVVTSALPKLVW